MPETDNGFERRVQAGPDSAEALNDDELDSVTGGYNVVFGDGLDRDSWFVSYVTRRMVRDSISREMTAGQGTVPDEITVRGRRFLLSRNGEQIVVTAAP